MIMIETYASSSVCLRPLSVITIRKKTVGRLCQTIFFEYCRMFHDIFFAARFFGEEGEKSGSFIIIPSKSITPALI